MKRRTITSFISSKYRGATDKTYDLTVDYPDEGISCKDNEYIELNVVSFDMPNNMYNINSLNNTLQVNGVNKYIQNGNYSVKTFKRLSVNWAFFCQQAKLWQIIFILDL